MDTIKYVNIETWELLTLNQLKDFYNTVVVIEEPQEYNTFSYWLECCMTKNNGSLENVYQVTKENICHVIGQSDIPTYTQEILDSTEIYATARKSFYTTDGRYFYNIDELLGNDDICR